MLICKSLIIIPPFDINFVFHLLPQVLTYSGFFDANLEWMGLEGVQIVASTNPGSMLGCHSLIMSTHFTSVVRICSIGSVYNIEMYKCI